MTKAIRNETEAMVTMTTIMEFGKIYDGGQDLLYLHYHDAQYTSIIKILSVIQESTTKAPDRPLTLLTRNYCAMK